MHPTFDACDRPRRAGRRTVFVAGGLLAAAAVAGAPWFAGRGTAAAPPGAVESRSLWISDSPLDDGRRLLLVVDPDRKHAAVYHVDAAAGTLTLKSTRDIGWDLLIEDFNAQPPKPADLKRMLEAGGQPAAR